MILPDPSPTPFLPSFTPGVFGRESEDVSAKGAIVPPGTASSKA